MFGYTYHENRPDNRSPPKRLTQRRAARHILRRTITTTIVMSGDLPFPGLSQQPKPKLPFLLTENLNAAIFSRLPSRYHTGRPRSKSKTKLLAPGVEELISLKTSFSVWDGLSEIQKHNWRLSDVQYFFLAGLTLFSLYIAPSAPTVKLLAVVGSVWLLLMPATGQFFRPSATIWIWLVYFFCSRCVTFFFRGCTHSC